MEKYGSLPLTVLKTIKLMNKPYVFCISAILMISLDDTTVSRYRRDQIIPTICMSKVFAKDSAAASAL